MTAYEVTKDLLDSAGVTAPATPKPRRRLGRLRAAAIAGMAGGALILAAPAATAAVQVSSAASHSAIAESASNAPESTMPSTITLTTRRTGSVIL